MRISVAVVKSVFCLMFLFSTVVYAQVDEDPIDAEEVDSGQFEEDYGQDSGNQNSEYSREAQVGRPSYGGSGCSDGTVSSALSPDKKSLSVIFDEYMIEVGESVGLRKDRKACKIKVPFVIPGGMQVSVVKMDYRGFNQLAKGAKSRFISSYYFKNPRNRHARVRKATQREVRFQGPLDDDFYITSKLQGRLSWSKCGKNTNLHIFNKMITRTNADMEDSMSVVDSLDLASSSSEYHLLWRKCKERVNPRRGNERRRVRPDRPTRRQRREARANRRNR